MKFEGLPQDPIQRVEDDREKNTRSETGLEWKNDPAKKAVIERFSAGQDIKKFNSKVDELKDAITGLDIMAAPAAVVESSLFGLVAAIQELKARLAERNLEKLQDNTPSI